MTTSAVALITCIRLFTAMQIYLSDCVATLAIARWRFAGDNSCREKVNRNLTTGSEKKTRFEELICHKF